MATGDYSESIDISQSKIFAAVKQQISNDADIIRQLEASNHRLENEKERLEMELTEIKKRKDSVIRIHEEITSLLEHKYEAEFARRISAEDAFDLRFSELANAHAEATKDLV